MSETDAFFTQTIIGAPVSVSLGRQLNLPNNPASEGLQVDLASGTSRLAPGERPWVVSTQPAPVPVETARMRCKRWLERHALAVAASGLLGWLATAAHWSLSPWR